ncbi:Sodium:neurotransmitter symporter family protein [Toxoplasma gondii MAS]|uniref:Sodium:neurotransmitter symporter family protein n=1 Tax=Toxoplasma gondii MAS TaxID=943118 RepID=A0A086PYX1_TOXGO|nr:Sodium:neurotransmitter symporter family protein [Toxoplasma gondii MAS]
MPISAGVSSPEEPAASLSRIADASCSPAVPAKKSRSRRNGPVSPLSAVSSGGSSEAAKSDGLRAAIRAAAVSAAVAPPSPSAAPRASALPPSPLASVPPQPVTSSAFSRSLSGRSVNSPFAGSGPIPCEKPPGPVDVVLEQPCIYKQQDFSVPLRVAPDAVSDGGSRRGSAASTRSTQNGSGKTALGFAGEAVVCVEKDGDEDRQVPFSRLASMSSSVMEWQSRFAFVLAAVGAAVGIGCVWRFPTYCYKFGGGAFLIPYFLMLVLVGMPLLALEMSLGQVFRGGHMRVFNLISPRLRGLAASTMLQAFFICAYYSVFLSWGLHYFFACWQTPLPWVVSPAELDFCTQFQDETACEAAGRPSPSGGESPEPSPAAQSLPGSLTETGATACVWLATSSPGLPHGHCTADIRQKAQDFLFSGVLSFSAAFPGGLALPVLLGLAFVWVQLFCSLFKGLQSLTAVIYAAVLLPVFAICLVMVSALTLDGASLGLSHLFSVNWEALVEQPEIWGEAASQVFFSLGVFQGVMTAYASHKKVSQNTILDATAVAASNAVLSFVSGVATFAIAGHVAKRVGEVDEATGAADLSAMNIAGNQLVFVLYPISLATLPAPQLFCALFFLAFFLLGITSAISFVQPAIDLLKESKLWRGTKRWKLTLAACVLGFVLGVPFCLRSGIYLIESADYHWSVVGLTFLGCCEAVAFGWVYGMGRQVEVLGFLPVAVHAFSYLGGVSLAALILFVAAPPSRCALALATALPLMLAGASLALYLCPHMEASQAPGDRASPLQGTSRKQSVSSLSAASRRERLGDPERCQVGLEVQAAEVKGDNNACFSALDDGLGRSGGYAVEPEDSLRSAEGMPPSSTSFLGPQGAAGLPSRTGRRLSIWDRIYWLYFGNVEHLRLHLNAITASKARVFCLWPVWSVVIKYVCPAILLFLLFNELGKGAFLYFGGLPLAYHIVAIAVLAFVAFFVFLGFLLPEFFHGFVTERRPLGGKVFAGRQRKNAAEAAAAVPAAGVSKGVSPASVATASGIAGKQDTERSN